jgi:hypothetical protein
MKAFLKRRWVLLSCVVVIILLRCLKLHLVWFDPDAIYTGYGDNTDGYVLFDEGQFVFAHWSKPLRYQLVEFRMNLPGIGYMSPDIRWDTNGGYVTFPMWLPLSVIFGWLVFRELRWREKRAKQAEGKP